MSREIDSSSSSSGKKRRPSRRRSISHLISKAHDLQVESGTFNDVAKKLSRLQITSEEDLLEIVRELRDVVVNEVRERIEVNQSLRKDLRLQAEAMLQLCEEVRLQPSNSAGKPWFHEEGDELHKRIDDLAEGVKGCRERVHGLGLAVAAQIEEREQVQDVHTRTVQFHEEYVSELHNKVSGTDTAVKDFTQRLAIVERKVSSLNSVHVQQNKSLEVFRAQLQQTEDACKTSLKHQLNEIQPLVSRMARMEDALCTEVVDRQKGTQSMNDAIKFSLCWSKEQIGEINGRLNHLQSAVHKWQSGGSPNTRFSSPSANLSENGALHSMDQKVTLAWK